MKRPIHVGLVLEQTLGHRTHTKNLQANVASSNELQIHWNLIPWEREGFAANLPVWSNWTVRAGWRARTQLAATQKRQPLDALFFHTQVPAMLAPDWIGRIPTVISLDATPRQYDSLGEFYQHQAGAQWQESLKWRLARRCFTEAKTLVTWSHWAKAGLVSDYDIARQKISVIPPGVNVREWINPAARCPNNPVVKVLFVGGDLERKGGQLLLSAFRRLRHEQESTPGTHGQRVELHVVTKSALAEEAGLFVYRTMEPNAPELKALFHTCDIFCLPTQGDCLPMVLSEAGAAGLPLVATAVGGINEIVRQGETGFLIPVGDEEALYQALTTLIENEPLRHQLGTNAQRLVTQEFDAGVNAQRLFALITTTAMQQ